MMFKNLPDKVIAYIQLHIAVVLFGFTAILGDLITLDATPLVWWRVLLSSISMILLVRVFSLVSEVGWSNILKFSGIGIITACHWVTFYASIKYANASVALVCLATTSLFTAFLEPFLLRTALRRLDIVIGLIIVPAMFLIVSNLEVSMYMGVYLGISSAVLAALFASLNKKLINKASPLRISFIELTSATLFLTIVLWLFFDLPDALQPQGNDWMYLIILALLCTTLAHYLSMASLRHISAFNSVLIINLEPVYGIILAALLLKEYQELTPNFYVGALIIIATVFAYPLLNKLSYFKE